MTERKFVAYYRVSTRQQGQSGLGLEAQQDAVIRFIDQQGALVTSFQEIESGKKKDRPALLEALRACRKHKATLIVAKLDRLARNVAFISSLMEAGVDFVAVDNPNANKLTLHILAAMAEYERELISERTKDGLKRAKARGVRLGAPDPSKASQEGVRVIKRLSQQFSENVLPIIQDIRSAGITSYRGIARALNARGVPTARGGDWYQGTVKRYLN